MCHTVDRVQASLSARRAWIEINAIVAVFQLLMSLSARRAWIEISIDDLEPSTTRRSLSARRAWIEIGKSTTLTRIACVALRKESVDRNCYYRRQGS